MRKAGDIDREAQPNAGEHDVESIEDFTEGILSLGVELTQGVVNKLPYRIQERSRNDFGDRTSDPRDLIGAVDPVVILDRRHPGPDTLKITFIDAVQVGDLDPLIREAFRTTEMSLYLEDDLPLEAIEG